MNYIKRKNEELNLVKIVLITAGIVLAAASLTVIIYKVVKKRFKITFECEDCDFSEEDCYGDDDGFAPEYVSEASDADDIFTELENEAE